MAGSTILLSWYGRSLCWSGRYKLINVARSVFCSSLSNELPYFYIMLFPGLEYVYSTAPKPLQAVAMGLLSAVEGLGSLLGTGLIGALSPAWIPQDRDYFQVLFPF